jgi:hypothetical protein
MAAFTPTVDVWTLDEAQRSKLQPGQWVRAGEDGPIGRWMGQGRATSVVAWLGNGRGRWRSYCKTLRTYAKSVGAP